MFKLSFDTDNAAMQSEDGGPCPDACARILERVARDIREGAGSGRVFDDNGNKIGTYKLS